MVYMFRLVAHVCGLTAVVANVDSIVRCQADSVYECGRQVGQQRGAALKMTVNALNWWHAPYLATDDGKQTFDGLLAANRNAYPAIVQEYEGMAEGAGVEPRHLFIAVLSNELHWFAKAAGFFTPRPKSCADYHVMDAESNRVWGHNEDEAPYYMPLSYLLEASIGNFSYVGFVYAPNAAGWAWAFNSYGVAQSINALNPRNVTVGIGVNFLARDVLNAVSLDDAISRACVDGLASGQHFNLGSIHEKDRQVMVETSPFGCDVRELLPPSGSSALPTVAYHANLYESEAFSTLPQDEDKSSVHRMKRFAELEPPQTDRALQAVQNAISDTKDKRWPIHRHTHIPDLGMTLNSVIFDVRNESVIVWGRHAPAISKPTLTYDWRRVRRSTEHAEEFAAVV